MKSPFERIYETTQARLENHTLVGASTFVSVKGKTVWNMQQGYSNYEKKIPLQPHALFRLASMTKPITAIAVMTQVEKGSLSLEDEVRTYIPSFADMKVGTIDEKGELVSIAPAQRPIFVRDLLTHTSGLGQGILGDKQFMQMGLKEGDTLSSIVPRLGKILLDFEPNTQTGYSPMLALDTAAYIVESITGMTYADYLKKAIFDPMEIADIAFSLTEEQQTRVVEMYGIEEDGIHPVDMDGHAFGNFPNSYTCAGASLYGSIEDYAKVAQMLLQNGEYHGMQVLSSQSVQQMQAPILPATLPGVSPAQTWGLAMRVITSTTHEYTPLNGGSYGWSGAYGTHFWIDPSLELTAVYCTNLTTAGGAGAVTAFEFEKDVMAAMQEYAAF